MDDNPFLGPTGYTLTWPLLGGLILLALIIWPAVVWLMTRKPDDDLFVPLPPAAAARKRREALAAIDEIEQRAQKGKITARTAHHELSKVVRGFVSEVSGLDAKTMTASDLRQRGPKHLADVIEAYYPRQFGAGETERPSVVGAARAAREVVGGWA